jgi:hypothetical protein
MIELWVPKPKSSTSLILCVENDNGRMALVRVVGNSKPDARPGNRRIGDRYEMTSAYLRATYRPCDYVSDDSVVDFTVNEDLPTVELTIEGWRGPYVEKFCPIEPPWYSGMREDSAWRAMSGGKWWSFVPGTPSSRLTVGPLEEGDPLGRTGYYHDLDKSRYSNDVFPTASEARRAALAHYRKELLAELRRMENVMKSDEIEKPYTTTDAAASDAA